MPAGSTLTIRNVTSLSVQATGQMANGNVITAADCVSIAFFFQHGQCDDPVGDQLVLFHGRELRCIRSECHCEQRCDGQCNMYERCTLQPTLNFADASLLTLAVRNSEASRWPTSTWSDVPRRSSASSARHLVGEITTLDMVQDHPALVKPIGWFTTPQDFAAIGIYVKHRSLKLPLDDSPMDVDWCMLPLFEYVLYDVVNEHRSFVHLFPSEGRVEVAWDRCANQLTMWPSGRRQKCSGLQRCPQTRRGCYNH